MHRCIWLHLIRISELSFQNPRQNMGSKNNSFCPQKNAYLSIRSFVRNFFVKSMKLICTIFLKCENFLNTNYFFLCRTKSLLKFFSASEYILVYWIIITYSWISDSAVTLEKSVSAMPWKNLLKIILHFHTNFQGYHVTYDGSERKRTEITFKSITEIMSSPVISALQMFRKNPQLFNFLLSHFYVNYVEIRQNVKTNKKNFVIHYNFD